LKNNGAVSVWLNYLENKTLNYSPFSNLLQMNVFKTAKIGSIYS